MSQWTHVAGIVRLDTFPGLFGHGNGLNGRDVALYASPIPAGSEGPLHVDAIENREGNSVVWGHIAIWGDLRDYGDARHVEELSEWFRHLCQVLHDKQHIIRQAVLLVRVEYKPAFVLSARYQGNTALIRVVSVPVPEVVQS